MDLPDALKTALSQLGEHPTTEGMEWGLIRELMARGLVEKHAGGIRFTDEGQRHFRELRGTWPERNV